MLPMPADIFTEPDNVSPDGLANLGPLRHLAGVWQADKGVDVNPKAEGPERRIFREHIRMDPIDPQTNGPQVFYGLRYHIHINTSEEDITFHDQVGYWLWEPATGLILQSVTIPRGQVLLASGQAKPDDKKISVTAKRGDTRYGICSTEFLDEAFRTDSLPLRHHLQRRRKLDLSDRDRASGQRERSSVQPSRHQHVETHRSAEAQSAGRHPEKPCRADIAQHGPDERLVRRSSTSEGGSDIRILIQSARLISYQQAQRCIVSNTLLANESHRIDPGAGIGVGAEKSDVLDTGRHRSPGRGMFLTGHFTLPVSSRALIASCVEDVGVAAMQLAVTQYQDTTNFVGHTVAGTSIQRIEPVLDHDCFHTTQSPTNIADAANIVARSHSTGGPPSGDNSGVMKTCGPPPAAALPVR